MTPRLWFWLSTALLTAMLFVPVSRLVWVLSVRRFETRLRRRLEPEELSGQLRRARFIAFFLSGAFALLFCLRLLGYPVDG